MTCCRLCVPSHECCEGVATPNFTLHLVSVNQALEGARGRNLESQLLTRYRASRNHYDGSFLCHLPKAVISQMSRWLNVCSLWTNPPSGSIPRRC